MSKEYEDCKTAACQALQSLYENKNKLKILYDRVLPHEKLVIAQSISLLLQSIDKAENSLALFIPPKQDRR